MTSQYRGACSSRSRTAPHSMVVVAVPYPSGSSTRSAVGSIGTSCALALRNRSLGILAATHDDNGLGPEPD